MSRKRELAFEDALELGDVIEAFDALLEQGIKVLPPGLSRSFERDDYATSLAIVRDHYSALLSGGRGSLREASMMYAILLIYKGLFDEAAGVLRKATAKYAQDIRLQLVQVLALIESDQADMGLELLDGLKEVKSKEPKIWSLMGNIYLDLGEIDDAIRCYKSALDLGGKDIEVAYRLSRLLWEDDAYRFDGARYLEQAARLAVNDTSLWSLAGQAWIELEEWTHAVECFQRVVRLDEDEEQGWMFYGEALREAGQYDAAIRAFEKASRLDPLDTSSVLELAYTLQKRGFYEEALRGYMKVLKEHPKHTEALQGASLSSYEMGDFEAALRYSTSVLESSPDLAEGYYNRGMIQIQLSHREAAKEDLQKAVELEPDNGSFKMRLLLARLDGEMVKSKDLTRLIHEAMAHNAELGELLEVLIRALYLGGEAKDIEQILDWYDPYAVEFEDVDWLLVTPVLRYALATSFGEDGADEHDARFSENIAKYEESLPVMVNLEVLEQFARKLPRKEKGRLERMCFQLLG